MEHNETFTDTNLRGILELEELPIENYSQKILESEELPYFMFGIVTSALILAAVAFTRSMYLLFNDKEN